MLWRFACKQGWPNYVFLSAIKMIHQLFNLYDPSLNFLLSKDNRWQSEHPASWVGHLPKGGCTGSLEGGGTKQFRNTNFYCVNKNHTTPYFDNVTRDLDQVGPTSQRSGLLAGVQVKYALGHCDVMWCDCADYCYTGPCFFFYSFHQQLPAYDIAKEKIKSLGLDEVRSNLSDITILQFLLGFNIASNLNI